jgi:hypothetical protein
MTGAGLGRQTGRCCLDDLKESQRVSGQASTACSCHLDKGRLAYSASSRNKSSTFQSTSPVPIFSFVRHVEGSVPILDADDTLIAI